MDKSGVGVKRAVILRGARVKDILNI